MTERIRYETIGGTEPSPDEPHEPRTILRKEPDDSVYMMSEIDDGVFVQWSHCRKCSKTVRTCGCTGGPQEADYITKWRTERFETSMRYRRSSEKVLARIDQKDEAKGLDLQDAIDAVKEARQEGSAEEDTTLLLSRTEPEPEKLEG